MRRRCTSPRPMMWSSHSRRIDPISRSAKPFCQGEAGAIGLSRNAHDTQSARDDDAIDSIPISDHIARSHVPRKSLGDLTCNPVRRRVGCDVNPNEISTIQPHDDERTKQMEANSRDNEQVHGGNVWSMITQKGAPSLAWRPASLDHVFGDTRLRDLKLGLEQLTVNARRPSGPGDFHPESLTDSGLDTLASSGSCHRLKAAACRSISGSSRCRVAQSHR